MEKKLSRSLLYLGRHGILWFSICDYLPQSSLLTKSTFRKLERTWNMSTHFFQTELPPNLKSDDKAFQICGMFELTRERERELSVNYLFAHLSSTKVSFYYTFQYFSKFEQIGWEIFLPNWLYFDLHKFVVENLFGHIVSMGDKFVWITSKFLSLVQIF